MVAIQTGAAASDTTTLKITKLDVSAVMGTVASGNATAGLGAALVSGDTRVGDLHTVSAYDVAYGGTVGGAAVAQADIGTVVSLAVGDQIYEEATTAGSVSGGALILQLHDELVEDHHGPLADPGRKPYGNGLML